MIRPSADSLLAQLLASAQGDQLDWVTLQAVVEEASEAGAARAMAALGLDDVRARRDMDDLRELLRTWRDVKQSAWQTVTRWIVRILLATLMLSIAYQVNLHDLLEG